MAKIALLIGSGQFESQDLEPLPKTSADLEAMKKALIDPELGGFLESDVTVLPNPEKQQMEDAIYDLFDRYKRKRDDLLLLYFSGHGITDETGTFYFSTQQTRKDNGRLRPTTALSSIQVHKYMNKCRSKRIAIILDCCHSGAFPDGMSAKGTVKPQIEEQLGGEGRAILTAARATEYAWAKDELPLSAYTYYLLEGVNTGEADQDGNDWLSLKELHYYAKRKIVEANLEMTPEFYPVREGGTIRLFKAKIINPQDKYKKAIERYYVEFGEITPSVRRRLENLRQKLNITPKEAQRIEQAVVKAIKRKQENLKEYESFSQDLLNDFGSLDNDFVREELKRYQEELELTDEDVEPIHREIEENNQPPCNGVVLISEKGVDYTKLCNLLAAGKWKEADQETFKVMLKAANRVSEGWLGVEDIHNFPCDDLRTIDQLWVKYSKGKFGFSVQKKIYMDELGGIRGNNAKIWYEFCDRVDWREGGDDVRYSDLSFELLDTTPVGHLPRRYAEVVGWAARIREFFSRTKACEL
ncbi:MAG: GUN4 domain-containing protein [Crocosphaera sp.]